MKRFKYCTDEQLTKVVENYKYGGKTNLIYVLIEEKLCGSDRSVRKRYTHTLF